MPDYVRYNAQGLIVEKWRSADPSVVEGLSNILEIPRAVYDTLTQYKVVDSGAVRDMTPAEMDAYDQWVADKAAQAEEDRLNAIDDSMDSTDMTGIKLQKVETAIDNIGSLADAKVFLKKLCRYIVARSNV